MGLFNWLTKGKKGKEVAVEEATQVKGISADIPANLPCVFVVNGTTFIGSYIGNQFGDMQFVVSEGLLIINDSANVEMVRIASVGESKSLIDTHYKIDHDHVVRFLHLQDMVA